MEETTGSVRERLTRRLEERLAPTKLEVVDESHHHAGHMGARPEGETHFRVIIEAEAFRNASRVERHRMVNDALSEELSTRVHALAIDARAPD